jgi:RNA polymerase sigma-70 factor (ECF subfamily)
LASIQEIKSGTPSSFSSVFNEFHGKLYYYFLKKTKSAEMAGELVQLTFIRLWQFRHTLSEDISFDSQLFTMAGSAFIDYLRRQNTLRKNTEHLPGTAPALPHAFTMEAEADFENTDYLHRATQFLPPVRKKIFILSRVHGYSYKEIALRLSISVKTVEDHMVKALKHIRSITLPVFLLLLLLPY